MCCKSSNSCTAVREKNSNRLKAAHQSGVMTTEFGGKRGWSKGKTKDDCPSLERTFERRITDETKLERVLYREQCGFNLAGVIHRIKGFELLKKYGMYHRVHNVDGVVRDHRLSVQYGFDNKIDPRIISHPANCEFLTHKKNACKTHQSSLTLDELIVEIERFNADVV